MSVMPYGSPYFGQDSPPPVSPDVEAQLNYEMDLLNRILALGFTTRAEAKAAGKLLYGKIKGMHDRAEQERVLEVLYKLKDTYGFVPRTREQVDHLVWRLRVLDWNLLDGEKIVAELQQIDCAQRSGQVSEVDAYAVMGNDARPKLREIWLNPDHKDQRKAAEVAKRLDLVRRLRHSRVLNEAAGVASTPALQSDLQENERIVHDLSVEMGMEKDVNYTLTTLEVSEQELGEVLVDPTTAVEQDEHALDKAAQAEEILATPDTELDSALDEMTRKDNRQRWLVGGAFLLGLLYISRRPRA